MRRVKCYECGKRYDFDVDDFCPKCGAFTQPPRSSRIGADGAVVRVGGLNENNHRNSFVHAELHEEDRDRRGTLLEGMNASLKKAGFQGARLSGYKPAKKGSDGFAAAQEFLRDVLGWDADF